MVDYDALDKRIKKSPYTKQYLSERLGLSSDGLKRKLMGQTDFKLGEVALLAKLLNWKVHVDFGIYTGGET